MPKFKETDDFIVDLREKSSERGRRPVANFSDSEESKFRTLQGRAGSLPASHVRNFIQYNNAFLIVLVVGIMAFSGLVFASEDIRDATIGGKQVSAEGVDNTLLLATDLDAFRMDFTIMGIAEDSEQFVVSYSFVDLDIADGMSWQLVEKTATRRISKPFRRDLGLYLAEQLSQEQKARVKELKKLQTEAREQGETKVVQVSEYSGLIGKVLDLSAAVFEGYEPVKKVELPTPVADTTMLSRTQNGNTDNLTNVYNEWVESNPDLVESLNNTESPASGSDDEVVDTDEHGLGTDNNGSQIDTDMATVAEEAVETAETQEITETQNTTESKETQEIQEPAEMQGPVEGE